MVFSDCGQEKISLVRKQVPLGLTAGLQGVAFLSPSWMKETPTTPWRCTSRHLARASWTTCGSSTCLRGTSLARPQRHARKEDAAVPGGSKSQVTVAFFEPRCLRPLALLGPRKAVKTRPNGCDNSRGKLKGRYYSVKKP